VPSFTFHRHISSFLISRSPDLRFSLSSASDAPLFLSFLPLECVDYRQPLMSGLTISVCFLSPSFRHVLDTASYLLRLFCVVLDDEDFLSSHLILVSFSGAQIGLSLVPNLGPFISGLPHKSRARLFISLHSPHSHSGHGSVGVSAVWSW
jgi:hypothetical protein